MATQLNKEVTREVELTTGESTDTKTRTYYVTISPDMGATLGVDCPTEPGILIREKGLRGRAAHYLTGKKLSELVEEAEGTGKPETEGVPERNLNGTSDALDYYNMAYGDIMSKIHVEFGDDLKTLTKVRDALRDLYIIELMVDEDVSNESLLKVTDSLNKGDK